jgi:membrane protease YdiL (CAAX protease family)
VAGESLAEIGRMVMAGGIVAAFAIPFGLFTAAVVRRRRLSLLPRWKPWRVPWGGFEVFAVFLIVVVLVPVSLVKFGGVPEQAASLAAFPIQIALVVVVWRALYPRWRPFRRDAAVFRSDVPSADQPLPIGAAFARSMTLAVLAWTLLTPPVLVIHGFVNWMFTQFDLTPEQLPLKKFGGEGWEQVSLLLQACLVAPIIEELVFRGILLPWMVGARERNAGGLQLSHGGVPAARPLVVMAIAVLYSGASGKIGAVIFAGVLTLGLALLWGTVRHGRRHVRAVYVSAAFFGMVHSAVWPTPIPLFFLGLALGWLAVRTRGILVPVVVHGLFNAVSAVYVLRSAA